MRDCGTSRWAYVPNDNSENASINIFFIIIFLSIGKTDKRRKCTHSENFYLILYFYHHIAGVSSTFNPKAEAIR